MLEPTCTCTTKRIDLDCQYHKNSLDTLKFALNEPQPINWKEYICNGVHCKCWGGRANGCKNYHNGDHACPANTPTVEPTDDMTVDDQIDDIVLATAEWQADDYYAAKGLIKQLIATTNKQAVEKFAEKVIGDDEDVYHQNPYGQAINVGDQYGNIRNQFRAKQRQALKDWNQSHDYPQ
jgi:hypothetical protein